MNKLLNSCLLAFGLVYLGACGQIDQPTNKQDTDSVVTPVALNIPKFNADTAYDYIAKQLSFGFRTPGSPGQAACADWMEQMLQASCDTVYRQQTTVTGGDKKSLRCINIIGAIHPNATRRVLLLAHWDSRPWADEDTKDKDKPILAADDAGSGVAVLLELARTLKNSPLPKDLGVDILMTDVEDYGRSEWGENSYCLGTQYWATHPHVPGYKADFGILLDMVGAKDARFPMEQSSTQYAQNIQQNVWQAATRAGYSSFFPPTPSRGGVTDDHVYVNELARIPTIDIINLSQITSSGFAPHWHTHADNMDIISKETLTAVGQTLLQVLFETAHP